VTEIAFYHLERSNLEAALPKLLEKALSAGFRCIVKVRSAERIEALNAALWTYDAGSFLPHGAARDGDGPEQPVWLTDGDDNPNGARLVVLTDGAEAPDIADFERCLEMFDGRDEEALALARRHWAAYREAGHDLTYWRQSETGAWRKQEIG
jgi:DNA polymerase-3 subunit chi